jgi:hypothetical protein
MVSLLHLSIVSLSVCMSEMPSAEEREVEEAGLPLR